MDAFVDELENTNMTEIIFFKADPKATFSSAQLHHVCARSAMCECVSMDE